MAPWLSLIRLGNVLLSGAAAIVGAYLSTGRTGIVTWLLIPIAPMLITAAGNIQNDLCDIEIDRLNRPDRPLAAGAIRLRSANWTMVLMYLGGLIAAGILGPMSFVLAALVVGLLIVYNISWSRLPGVGNLAVSLMGALPVVYGGACATTASPASLLIPAAAALVAFWLHLARELLKDTIDVEGDRAANRRTLPIIFGHATSMRLSALIMLTAAGCALWLGTTGWLNPLYMFGICVTILPALLYGAAQCWWRPELPIASLWAGWIKVIMLAGLVWMLLGVRPS
jgi:geranylgeranylglycerol-phosphate geranylgeranyltransferase